MGLVNNPHVFVPVSRVIYEARSPELVIIISYPTSASCFIKNGREILFDLADFSLQEQPEDNLVVAISRVWHNGSYTMVAKPIKSLELHYTMIQFFFVNVDIPRNSSNW